MRRDGRARCDVSFKVLLVEAEHRLIEELTRVLERTGMTIATAHNGVEALRAMQAERPEIVILDPTLAWLGGARIRRSPRIGSPPSGSPLIVVSARTGDSVRIPPTEPENEDESARNFDAEEVLAQVVALHKKAESTKHRSIVRAGVLEVDLERWTVAVEGSTVVVTAIEFGLLRLLLNSRGRVLTRDVMRDIVWEGGAMHRFDSRAVDVHIGRLRRKLGKAGAYIVTIRGVGYRFVLTANVKTREEER